MDDGGGGFVVCAGPVLPDAETQTPQQEKQKEEQDRLDRRPSLSVSQKDRLSPEQKGRLVKLVKPRLSASVCCEGARHPCDEGDECRLASVILDECVFVSEAAFKALAKAIRDAIEVDDRATGQVPSTKGTIS